MRVVCIYAKRIQKWIIPGFLWYYNLRIARIDHEPH